MLSQTWFTPRRDGRELIVSSLSLNDGSSHELDFQHVSIDILMYLRLIRDDLTAPWDRKAKIHCCVQCASRRVASGDDEI